MFGAISRSHFSNILIWLIMAHSQYKVWVCVHLKCCEILQPLSVTDINDKFIILTNHRQQRLVFELGKVTLTYHILLSYEVGYKHFHFSKTEKCYRFPLLSQSRCAWIIMAWPLKQFILETLQKHSIIRMMFKLSKQRIEISIRNIQFQIF